jgi:hypothetical protein
MTNHLKDVINHKLTKQTFQSVFYDEMVDLLNDEDLLVRLEAIEGIVEIMQSKLTPEQIEKDIIPVFLRHLEIDHDDECI